MNSAYPWGSPEWIPQGGRLSSSMTPIVGSALNSMGVPSGMDRVVIFDQAKRTIWATEAVLRQAARAIAAPIDPVDWNDTPTDPATIRNAFSRLHEEDRP
jgi:hypothetical protein